MAGRTPKVRHQLFLTKDLSDRLAALTAAPGDTKSAILVDALEAWLNRRGANELDERFAHRLNRISNQLERIERNGHIAIESLALFIRYMLMVTPPLGESDQAGRAIGAKRYNAFIEQVGRQLASGKRSFVPEDEP
jgi:predicted DNA-binding protein